MSDLNVNRYYSGDKKVIGVDFPSGTTVHMGDLIFFDNADSLRNDGTSSASFKGYPLEKLRASGASLEYNKTLVPARFLGVALDDKDGRTQGLEKKIAVATDGVFEFDLKPARTVKVGYLAGPSGSSEASDMLNQKVMYTTQTSKSIGRFVEYKVHAQKAKVQLHTTWGKGRIT